MNIRIVNYFRLRTANNIIHRYQNYFVNSVSAFLGQPYSFAPFQVEGSMASLNGDNQQLRVLFPNVEYALRLTEQGNGNRLSELELTTAWLNEAEQIVNTFTDFYIGIGAGFSETTLELRFRSAIDSVGSEFPGRTFTLDLVGPLPLNSELYLR